MKKVNIYYWIVTVLFAGFMIFSAVPDVLMAKEAVAYMHHLGYPDYFIKFIGAAKLLGCIAILIPGFPRIKEWAYAGLAFDLAGAIYSMVKVEGIQMSMLFMLLPIGLGAASYYLYHLRARRQTGNYYAAPLSAQHA